MAGCGRRSRGTQGDCPCGSGHDPFGLKTSNKMIQKGLAFQRERSGTVTVPGAKSPFGILPRRPHGHSGASVVAAPIAVEIEWRIP
jgi:hypothetical protein